MPPSKLPEMTRAVGSVVDPAELGNTVVRLPPLLPPFAVVAARVVVRVVVVLAVVFAVVVGLPPPPPVPGTHCEYQSFEYWQVYPETQLVEPVNCQR